MLYLNKVKRSDLIAGRIVIFNRGKELVTTLVLDSLNLNESGLFTERDLIENYNLLIATRYCEIEKDILKRGLKEIKLPLDNKECTSSSTKSEIIWDKISVALYFNNSVIDIGENLNDYVRSIVEAWIRVYGRGVVSKVEVDIGITNSTIKTMILDSIPCNISIDNCDGDILIRENKKLLDISNSRINFYSDELWVSKVGSLEGPLLESNIFIPAKNERDALLKFRRHMLNYDINIRDFINLNNIYRYETKRIEAFTNPSINLTLHGDNNNCTFSHLPSRSSMELEGGEYTSDRYYHVFQMHGDISYCPSDKLSEFTSYNLRDKFESCTRINKILLE